MLTVREIIKETTFDEVLKEIKKRHENKKITSKMDFLLRKLTKMVIFLLNCIKKLLFSDF